ncbi:hypothetical protein ACH5RR_006789 [Cinchona calisaya]|uniref:Uncharacterized protein n=1 Tax=Cinchona calisaya TaxID=153742 RepID=A0ABD3AQB0_9GENT
MCYWNRYIVMTPVVSDIKVSHHPPVTALHATDEKENIEMIWCHYPVSKFHGTHIETEVHGKRQLKLLNREDTYVMNSPKLVIRYLPMIGVDWLGNVTIKCQETGLAAELSYRGNSFLPRQGNYRSIKGKIFMTSSSKLFMKLVASGSELSQSRTLLLENLRLFMTQKKPFQELRLPL